MKTLTLPLTLLAFTAAPLIAQTASTTHPPVHRTAPAAPAAPVCAKVPELSPKIPALPAGSPCARTLYTITSIPSVKLENVSPMETRDLAAKLGIESSTFSLAYIDTKIGSGPLAEAHKWYTINYTGYLVDGTKFDSSLDAGRDPIVIPYGGHQVIPGWDTGFDGMHVGGKRRLFIPFQLAYGAQGKPPVIPERAELIFDVELVAQSDEKPAPKTPPTPPPAAPATQPAAAPAGTAPTKPATTPPASAPKL
jgi:peptidylprolyl isomerase